jgi:hypothetical protein
MEIPFDLLEARLAIPNATVANRRLQCAGLNRHEAEDESSLRERSSDPLGLESCAGYREVLSEA